MALDIGPATVDSFRRTLAAARTVFWNGPMGVFEKPQWATGTVSVARALADNKLALTVVGGGDSAAAIAQAGLASVVLSLVRYLRAILAVRRGDADETIALMRESLTRIGELRDKFAFVYALVPLAAAAVLKGNDAWAARILGAREAVTERSGATIVDASVDDLREQAEREVRARLGPDQWARAYAAGRTMSIDALLKDIEGVVQEE